MANTLHLVMRVIVGVIKNKLNFIIMKLKIVKVKFEF